MEKERIVDIQGYYLKDKENVIDYKIVHLEEEGVDKIFLCAVGDNWTDHVKNKVLFKITDTGNGIKISKKYRALLEGDDVEDGGDYSNMEYLRILLNYANLSSHMPAEYTIMAESDIIL